ncbi:SulP family inorganic anion transporter [Desulfonema magnum]|uniref:Sulfate permease n=1 Tax=Desulfonema magnum TaxID=45655 RepID=A0A975GR65_9BACT|nr:sulfate permease [Desulfonema magnum]QTA90716.1 Sulfate permease [Desulfonema magnum]
MKNNPLSLLLHHLFPFLNWVKDYDRSVFRADMVAGITVAVVLIPQSMAYAMLAGLPPIYGLYAGAIAPIIAALWGSLRQLATGPIAIMSLLVLTTLTPMAEPGSPHFIELAILLGHIVGILYLIMGVLRMGHVMAFISHSAVRGFTAAAALIIIATQMPNLLGLTVEKHEYILPMLLEILKGVPSLHASTALIGVISFAIIYGLKRIRPAFPASLLALLLTTSAVYFFNLHNSGVRIVGEFPGGLPIFKLPIFDMDIGFSLIGPAVIIALVSFAEIYSVGKVISSETGQKVDVNQEFIGQGLANIIGSFFQCPPVSGSFSRTAINFSAGARTGISGVVSGIIVIFALLFLTPLFTYIPKAALAALVISAVLLLFHPKEVFILWKKNHHDGAVAVTVFVLALLAKPDYALLIGVMISLMLFLWKTMHPRIVRISKDPVHNMLINADLYNKPSCPQILHLRSDNAIYFANAEYTVEHILERADEVETPLKFLLLDCTAIGFIDITGTDELSILRQELKTRNIRLVLTGVHIPVMNVFKTSGFWNELSSRGVIANKGDAITHLFHDIDHEYCRKICPYSLYTECSSVK